MTTKIIISAILLIGSLFAASAQRTIRKGLKASPETVSQNAPDTLRHDLSRRIKISGYDKPLRSALETMFVSNLTDSTMSWIQLELEYRDTHGRMLHSRTIGIDCDIPPEATRQISVRSWDRQQSFYYRRSAKPRRNASATQYDVACTVKGIVLRASETDDIVIDERK